MDRQVTAAQLDEGVGLEGFDDLGEVLLEPAQQVVVVDVAGGDEEELVGLPLEQVGVHEVGVL
jgi:hypothetical protein